MEESGEHTQLPPQIREAVSDKGEPPASDISSIPETAAVDDNLRKEIAGIEESLKRQRIMTTDQTLADVSVTHDETQERPVGGEELRGKRKESILKSVPDIMNESKGVPWYKRFAQHPLQFLKRTLFRKNAKVQVIEEKKNYTGKVIDKSSEGPPPPMKIAA